MLKSIGHLEVYVCSRIDQKIVVIFQIFLPETTDIYDKKNMPRLIFCLHALALFLYQKGLVRHQIQDLYGKVTFSQVCQLHV